MNYMRKNRWNLLLATMMGAMLLTGCGKTDSPKETSETLTETLDETETEYDPINLEEVSESAYDELIASIVDAFRDGWTSTTPEQLDVSEVLAYNDSAMGSVRMDLDGNGINELLIGLTLPDEATLVYDLYTTDTEGQLIHVFAGDERDYLCVTENNTLQEYASDGADSSTETEYELKECILSKIKFTKKESCCSLSTVTFMSLIGSDDSGAGELAFYDDFAVVMDAIYAVNPSSAGSSLRGEAAAETVIDFFHENGDMIGKADYIAMATQWCEENDCTDAESREEMGIAIDSVAQAVHVEDDTLEEDVTFTNLIAGMKEGCGL